MKKSYFPLFYAVSLLLISIGGTTWAQVESSSLTGTVTDQQGKFVPHAKVRAIQVATWTSAGNGDTSQGNYQLVYLPAGSFSVQISKEGFSIFHPERVEQIVGQTRTLNARLDVSGASQQASITEPLVQLDRVEATIGAPVEQEQISERSLPLCTMVTPRRRKTTRSLAKPTPKRLENTTRRSTAASPRTLAFAILLESGILGALQLG